MTKTFLSRQMAVAGCFLVSIVLASYEGYNHYFNDDQSTNDDACMHVAEIQSDDLDDSDQVTVAEVEENELEKVIHLTIGSGDTLAKLLNDQGLSATDGQGIINSLHKLYSPRSLKPGHEIQLTLMRETKEATPALTEMRIRPDIDHVIVVQKLDDGGFKAEKKQIKLIEEKRWAESPIVGSLYETAAQFKVPSSIMQSMIKAFSYDVDFQRSLKDGDSFGVMYTVKTDPETGRQRPGELLYAMINTQGKPHHVYYYQPKGGVPGFYNQNGESIKKGLLRTPVDGARISSRFGNRHHPVLGYTKAHKGVDFACPTGTPILAAGEGVVERASRYGAYGNYVRVRHSNGYQTAYAHLSKYAKGVRPGKRVAQGQVIGYVGATGRTTGAHLHYEVLVSNKHINPLSVKLIPAAKLNGKEHQNFMKTKKDFDFQYAELKKTTTLASAHLPNQG